jgi:hypothetical protein
MASDDSTPQFKTCTSCGESKPPSAFTLAGKRNPGKFRSQCKPCRRIAKQAWKAAHPETSRASDKAYAQANKAKINARMLTWRHAHPESGRLACKTYNESHKESRRQYSQAYWRKHRSRLQAKGKIYCALNKPRKAYLQGIRRARKQALPDTFTYEQEQFCRQYFHYTCAYCGQEASFSCCIAMDHFIPLESTACPGSVVGNMLPACHGDFGCNNTKRSQDPHVWLLQRFGKRKAAQIIKHIEAYFAVVRWQFP